MLMFDVIVIDVHITGLSARVNDDKEDTASLLSKLDKADLIVALLSPKFLLDPDLIEALQVAINRQRYDKHTRLYPVLLSSTLPPSTPTSEDYKRYCELLMYELSYEDPIWSSLTLGMYHYATVQCRAVQCSAV